MLHSCHYLVPPDSNNKLAVSLSTSVGVGAFIATYTTVAPCICSLTVHMHDLSCSCIL